MIKQTVLVLVALVLFGAGYVYGLHRGNARGRHEMMFEMMNYQVSVWGGPNCPPDDKYSPSVDCKPIGKTQLIGIFQPDKQLNICCVQKRDSAPWVTDPRSN